MKKVVLGLSLMGGLLSASATDYLWYAADKSATGDFNGVYTNVCNWFISGKVNDGHVDTLPQTGADSAVASRYGSTYTVTFPAGMTVTNFAKFVPSVSPGMKVTFDGTGSRFLMPTNDARDYADQGQVQFNYRKTQSDSTVYDLLLRMANSSGVGSDTTAKKWAPVCDFDDFKFTLEAPAGSREAKIDFERGTYNFYNPLGVEWSNNYDMPVIYLFGGLQGNKSGATLDKMEVTLGPTAKLTAKYLDLMGAIATTNIFTYTGGSHVHRSLGIGTVFNGWSSNEHATRQDYVLDHGTDVEITGSLSVFNRDWWTNRVARVIVKDNSTLTLNGAVDVVNGTTEFLVDHSTLKMGWDGKRDQNVNHAWSKFVRFAVTNGSTWVLDHMGAATASNGKGFYFGSRLAGETEHRFAMLLDNSTLLLKNQSKINFYRATADIRNGSLVEVTNATFAVRGGETNGGVRAQMTVDNSRILLKGSSTMNIGFSESGHSSPGVDMTLTNGAVLAYQDDSTGQFFDTKIAVKDGSVLDFAGGRIQFRGLADGPEAQIVVDGGTVSNRAAYFALGDLGHARLVVTNGGTFVVNNNVYMGGNDGDSSYDESNQYREGIIDVCGGTVTLAADTAYVLRMGYRPRAKGVLNVYSGLANFQKPGNANAGLEVGYYGTGEVNLYGGQISTFRSWVGLTAKTDYDYANDDESVVRIYGGEYLINDQGNGDYVGFRFGTDSTTAALNTRRTRLVLNGGALTAYTTFGGTSAQCRGGTGYSALEADGGTVRPNTIASTVLIHHFDEAKVGAKGLTFDNRGFANAVPQHVWSNKEDEEGRLVFTGGGSTTVTGDVSEVSYLIADGATLNLSKLKNYTVGTLVVTNGGSVVLDPTRTLTVKGEFRVHDTGTIAFGSAVAVGTSCALLRQPQAPAAETLAALRDAMMSARVTGLGSNRTADFAVSEDDGKFALEMTVRAPQTLVIPLEAGAVSNATETFTYDSLDTLLAEVGEGAALTLGGLYRYGAFRLDGGGKIAIDRLDERIDGAVSVKNGVLEPTVAGVYTKPIVFDAAGTNDIFVVKNDVDVTFPMPTGNKKGEFVKRGTGRLTFEVTGAVNFSGGVKGLVEGSYGTWGTTGKSVEQLKFDAQSGMVTNSGVPSICVVEGELRLVGKGTGASVTCGSPTAIGISTKEGTVQPGLVLDNVALNVGAWSYVSPSINYASGAYARTGDFAKEAYLVLTNGAKFTCSQFEFAREAVGSDVRPSLIVDRSTFNPANWFEIGIGPDGLLKSEVVFRNSRLYTRRYVRGTAVPVWFYNTVIANNEHEATAGLEPITIAAISDTAATSSGTAVLHLRAGSELHCGTIDPRNHNPARYTPITLDFEDSTWIPTTKLTDDYTFEWANPAQVLVAVTNGGLRLPVGAGAVWTMKQPVIGPGDLVNSGEGTLKLGPDAVAFTGALRTDAGTVDFDGNALAPLIAGGGTFANGTLTGGIEYTSEEKVPTLDGLALATDVRVKFVVPDAETPGETYTVAKYTGDAAPDVSTLRFKSGAGVPLKGAFTVDTDAKKITCTTALNGMILILE